MNIHVLDPLLDDRWDDLVARHPRASAFHERGWLEALSRTYGYEPLVLTSAPAGEPLKDGLVLCRVYSWLTGARLVSLPFADHCEPLLNEFSHSLEFVNWLRTECDRQRWKYIEFRPLSPLRVPAMLFSLVVRTSFTILISSGSRSYFSRIPQRFYPTKDPAGRKGRAFIRSRPFPTTAGRILSAGLDHQEAPSIAPAATILVRESDQMHGRQDPDQGGS